MRLDPDWYPTFERTSLGMALVLAEAIENDGLVFDAGHFYVADSYGIDTARWLRTEVMQALLEG